MKSISIGPLHCSFHVLLLNQLSESGCLLIPGPLTLRMMLRVVSSMNSTRTWVTPPREPVVVYHGQIENSFFFPHLPQSIFSSSFLPESIANWAMRRTGAAEDSGDLDELDGDPIARCVSISAPLTSRVALFALPYFAESIFAERFRGLKWVVVVLCVVLDVFAGVGGCRSLFSCGSADTREVGSVELLTERARRRNVLPTSWRR